MKDTQFVAAEALSVSWDGHRRLRCPCGYVASTHFGNFGRHARVCEAYRGDDALERRNRVYMDVFRLEVLGARGYLEELHRLLERLTKEAS